MTAFIFTKKNSRFRLGEISESVSPVIGVAVAEVLSQRRRLFPLAVENCLQRRYLRLYLYCNHFTCVTGVQ